MIVSHLSNWLDFMSYFLDRDDVHDFYNIFSLNIGSTKMKLV